MPDAAERYLFVERIAPLLFGDRWVAPLARALGVDPSLVHRWRVGERAVQAEHVERLVGMARERVGALRATYSEIADVGAKARP
jgi:hypothetical protein